MSLVIQAAPPPTDNAAHVVTPAKLYLALVEAAASKPQTVQNQNTGLTDSLELTTKAIISQRV